MPAAMLPTLSADEVDDLLYLARVNDIDDLKAGTVALAQARKSSFETVTSAAIDLESGNGLLHMAAANNCIDVLNHLLPSSSPSSYLNLNLPNSSGNTPLHWAALNGHLDAVKLLVNAGADPAARNHAGHDAVYEAERSGKDEVVEWLLSEGRGLERGLTSGSGEREEEAEDEESERELKGGGEVDGELGEIQNGIKDVDLGKRNRKGS
ncbi:MAG: hypothetical protein Q9211_000893 [Gyalolechia sp. 1 TL-2023]